MVVNKYGKAFHGLRKGQQTQYHPPTNAFQVQIDGNYKNKIGPSTIPALYSGIIQRHYTAALYSGTIYRHYIAALYTGTI